MEEKPLPLPAIKGTFLIPIEYKVFLFDHLHLWDNNTQ